MLLPNHAGKRRKRCITASGDKRIEKLCAGDRRQSPRCIQGEKVSILRLRLWKSLFRLKAGAALSWHPVFLERVDLNIEVDAEEG